MPPQEPADKRLVAAMSALAKPVTGYSAPTSAILLMAGGTVFPSFLAIVICARAEATIEGVTFCI